MNMANDINSEREKYVINIRKKPVIDAFHDRLSWGGLFDGKQYIKQQFYMRKSNAIIIYPYLERNI